MSQTSTASQTSAPRSLGDHLVPLRRNWGWLMGIGIALIALGAVGLAAAFLFSLVSTIAFGLMTLVGGIVLIVDAARREGWKSRVPMLLVGFIYLITAALVFYNPLSALVALTLLVAAMLIAAGLMRAIMAFHLRPMLAWGWVLASGILSILLGALILATWPASSAWVLGTFLAIELIFQGWAYVILAWSIRSTFDGVSPRPGGTTGTAA